MKTNRNIITLFATRIVRLFCYGFLSVVLALYLAAAGLSEKQIGLLRLAKIVHAADVSEDIDKDPIARGLEAIASGYSLRFPEDEENLAAQFEVYDALYAWCRLNVAKS